jgi:hypothetical protein
VPENFFVQQLDKRIYGTSLIFMSTETPARMQSYRIPAHLIPVAKAKAARNGVTVTSVVVGALTEYVEDVNVGHPR